MEKTKLACMVESDFLWNDLGTWLSYKNFQANMGEDNYSEGTVLMSQTTNSLIKFLMCSLSDMVAMSQDLQSNVAWYPQYVM